MSTVINCPRCGSENLERDRFCGECGFDMTAAAVNFQPPRTNQPLSTKPSSRNALLMVVIILVAVFIGGGGLYWWLYQGGDESGPDADKIGRLEQTTANPTSTEPPAAGMDLSRAAAYLPEAGLKCEFFTSFPDGSSGNVERVSARVVPAEAVRVSEVEINIEGGETAGYGFHYVERADGTYYIYDQTPMEAFPVLKNNLTVGQTWYYQDEFGKVVWTVLDMGVALDLGFTTLSDCLLVEEDNQAVGLKTITFYAPGMGRVMVKSSVEGAEFMKLTAFSHIDAAQAADIVAKWAPNYAQINDDRTQS